MNYSAFFGLDGSTASFFISISTHPDLHFLILESILSKASIPAIIRADNADASILLYTKRLYFTNTTSNNHLGEVGWFSLSRSIDNVDINITIQVSSKFILQITSG
jgi:hypothetical protein